MKKNQRGVTLIALVVTIIVLLILAATAIATLTGEDGIITNAQKAQAANIEGEVIDKMSLGYNSVYTNAMVKMSTQNGYQPSAEANVQELVNILVKEIGKDAKNEGTTAVPTDTTIKDGKYHVYYSVDGANKTAKITILYGDGKFALKANETPANNLYPNLKAEIELTSNSVNYKTTPTRSVK